jgi:hypothetical protein
MLFPRILKKDAVTVTQCESMYGGTVLMRKWNKAASYMDFVRYFYSESGAEQLEISFPLLSIPLHLFH